MNNKEQKKEEPRLVFGNFAASDSNMCKGMKWQDFFNQYKGKVNFDLETIFLALGGKLVKGTKPETEKPTKKKEVENK